MYWMDLSEQELSHIEAAVENLRAPERSDRTVEAAWRFAFTLAEIAKRARQTKEPKQ